jgi:hypothetical protein
MGAIDIKPSRLEFMKKYLINFIKINENNRI